MRNRAHAAVLSRLVASARFEVLPTPSVEEKVVTHVPVRRTVTVTASPAKGLEATLDLTERLAGHGYDVVPHLAARMVRDRAELSDVCDRLLAAGVTAVFVPGGDQTPPAGDYPAALDLLQDLKELGNPFPEVGITGYPESHPTISDDLTVQAMWDKRRHATHIVSNLNFDPQTLQRWIDRLRSRGIDLPVIVGAPGPAERAKLLTMATKIGVGDSTRFLMKHKKTFAMLAAPGGYSGEQYLEKCARTLARPESNVTGLHLFTFNQIAETERWCREFESRLTAVHH